MPNPGSQKKGSANLFYQGAQGESIAPCPGDVDLNGTVDDDDIGVITAFYETTGAGWAQGDFSGDGYVGSEDYGVAASYYELVPARSVSRTWDWSLDGVGNWAGYREDAGAGGQGNWDLDQTRLHNKVNEIDVDDNHGNNPGASITASVGDNWIDPGYDAAGNMTSGPKPGSETVRLHFVFDAWNRLAAVWQDDGDGVLEKEGSPPQDTLLATYRYDATGRRIRKLLGTNPAAPTLALDYYHNNGGQIIEVHKDGDDDHPLQQYVWSPRYVHAPILRWRDGNGDGDFLDANETLYYCADANFNVTALVDTAGAVVERYLYDPYGKVTFLKADWSLQEGDEQHPAGTISAVSNELLFTGHRLDPESGLYITLHRHYHPTLGRWMQRDPKGYVDGMSLYEYVRTNPLTLFDMLGGEAAAAGSQGEAVWKGPLPAVSSMFLKEGEKVSLFQAEVRVKGVGLGTGEARFSVEVRVGIADGDEARKNWNKLADKGGISSNWISEKGLLAPNLSCIADPGDPGQYSKGHTGTGDDMVIVSVTQKPNPKAGSPAPKELASNKGQWNPLGGKRPADNASKEEIEKWRQKEVGIKTAVGVGLPATDGNGGKVAVEVLLFHADLKYFGGEPWGRFRVEGNYDKSNFNATINNVDSGMVHPDLAHEYVVEEHEKKSHRADYKKKVQHD